MKAAVGDRIVIKGHHVGEPDRDWQRSSRSAAKPRTPPTWSSGGDDGHVGPVLPRGRRDRRAFTRAQPRRGAEPRSACRVPERRSPSIPPAGTGCTRRTCRSSRSRRSRLEMQEGRAVRVRRPQQVRAPAGEVPEREVELNRRLAPDVYLGVDDVVDEAARGRPLVKMRRLPADRRLSTLTAAHGGFGDARRSSDHRGRSTPTRRPMVRSPRSRTPGRRGSSGSEPRELAALAGADLNPVP